MMFKDLKDTLGRPLRDLRISVTDRCNFRCTYCMPKEIFGRDYVFMPRQELLSFEEIYRLAQIVMDFGVKKIRITGGEPLVRQEIERLIEMLASLSDLDLTLTTNGALLPQKADALKNAGLNRITISLDSLEDSVFMAMNDVRFPVERVLEGIQAAEEAGLLPIKINMVVKRGVNESSILPMARYFRKPGYILRFIEFMDVGHTNGWRMEDVVSAKDIVKKIDAEMPLEPADPNYQGEVAKRWKYQDGSGEVGMIASVTQPFCGDCTRMRLSADGKLYTCLFATQGHEIKSLLRAGTSDEDLRDHIAGIWRRRADRYSEIRSSQTIGLDKIEMSYIGG